MGALLPVAALAAAFLLLGGKKASAATSAQPLSVPTSKIKLAIGPARITSTKPAAKKPAVNDALDAAQRAEKQMGAPKPSASANKNAGVAQVVPGTAMPPGYSRTQATSKAQPTADHIRTRKGKYDRAVLMSFQTAAGLRGDGLYGPQSAAALRYFGAKNVPSALFKGSLTTYAPPKGG